MLDDEPAVEFHIRVKLPSGGAFASCPSGDAEYEQAYNDAIFKEKPAGFEVRWPRVNQKWPVDSEGYTWVPLTADDYTPDERAKLLQKLFDVQKQYRNLRERIEAI